jgi:hypothetical protein
MDNIKKAREDLLSAIYAIEENRPEDAIRQILDTNDILDELEKEKLSIIIIEQGGEIET